jgi:hypothetical protein
VQYLEGRITLRPFEREAVYSLSQCTDDDHITFDGREDAAIEIMRSYNEPVHIAILGGDHALGGPRSCPGLDLSERTSFSDNINALNVRSRKKVALVEVTLRGFDAFEREYHRLYREVVEPTILKIAKREAAKRPPQPKVITIRGCGPNVTIE